MAVRNTLNRVHTSRAQVIDESETNQQSPKRATTDINHTRILIYF